MSELRIKRYVFPWPPSLNSLYCQGKTHGQKFLTKAGKEYKEKVKYLHANDDMNAINYPCRVRIELFPPNRAIRDLDNYPKPVLDGVKYVELIEDDSIFTKMVVIKNPPSVKYNAGLVLVTIKEDVPDKRDLEQVIANHIAKCNINEDDLKEICIKESKAYLKRMQGESE